MGGIWVRPVHVHVRVRLFLLAGLDKVAWVRYRSRLGYDRIGYTQYTFIHKCNDIEFKPKLDLE